MVRSQIEASSDSLSADGPGDHGLDSLIRLDALGFDVVYRDSYDGGVSDLIASL